MAQSLRGTWRRLGIGYQMVNLERPFRRVVLPLLAGLIGTSTASFADPAPPQAGAAGVAAANCPHITEVCALLADPAVASYVGIAENAWDFTASGRDVSTK
jgi:hypothetical protein